MSQQNPRPYNRPINHIALSCSDLSALVPWYVEVLGFELLGEVRHFRRSEDPAPFETIFVSYPKSLQELKFAILTTGNGVGIECFQFIDPPHKPQEQAFDFSRAGFFHMCVTDPNPEALVQSICDRGGKKIGDWMGYSVLGLSGHKGIYTQDPWGNNIEVMSLTMERVASAGEALAHVINMRKKL